MNQDNKYQSINHQTIQKIQTIIGDDFQSLNSYNQLNYKNNDYAFKYIGQKLFAALLSVVLAQQLVNKRLTQTVTKNIAFKNIKDQAGRDFWMNYQLKKLTRRIIHYNSVVFSSKVILDEYYKQTIEENRKYFQNNSLIHYKIGANVGFITYFLNIVIEQWKYVRNSMQHYQGSSTIKKFSFSDFNNDVKQFFKIQTFKNMFNKISMLSLTGVVLYRSIYFGGYQKIKNYYKHPLNQYLFAPFLCSILGLIVSPIDNLKYLQMTTHKNKTFSQILNQKGFKIWQTSNQRLFVQVIKQGISMMFFVAGQKVFKQLIYLKKTY